MVTTKNSIDFMRLRYFSFFLGLIISLVIYTDCYASKIKLTEAEQSWLSNHSVVRIHTPYGFPPMAFYEGNQWQGIFRDYTRLISERSGVNFVFVNFPFSQQEEKAKSREVDILHSYNIQERKTYMNFSHPFFTTGWVIVSRSDAPFVSGVDSLKNKKVAIVKGVRGYDHVVKKYPEVLLLNASSALEAMEAVSDGKADATVGPMISMVYYIHKKGMNNLKISGMTDYPKDPMMYAIRNDWPELQSIIDKALASISQTEHDAILQKWVPVRLEYVPGWREFFDRMSIAIILIALSILSIIAYWNRKLVREIDIRKKLESSLRESEDRYRTLIENSRDLIFAVDRKASLTYVNPTLERILGYSEGDLKGKSFSKILAPECLDSLRDIFRRALRGENIPVYETILIGKDGERIIAEFSSETLYDDGGKPIGRSGIGRNITDRKHAEAAQKESEEKLGTTLQGLPAPTFVIDSNHQIVYWNHAIEHYSNIEAKDIVGTKNHWRAFYPFARPCLADLIVDGKYDELNLWYNQKHRKSPIVEDAYELIDYFPDLHGGSWLLITAALILNSRKEMIGVIETFQDVTQQKHIESMLRESELRYQLVSDYTYEWEFWLGTNGETIYNSPSCERISGYPTESFIEDPALFQTIIHPEDRDLWMKHHHHPFESDHEIIFRIFTKKGEERIIEHICQPVYDSDGNYLGRRGSNRDITQRKKAEEALKESEEKYRDIFNTTVEGIYRTTNKGQFIVLNPAFARICGYASPEEMMEEVTDVANQLYANPEDRLRFQERIAVEGEVKFFEVQFKHPIKELVWISIHARALRDGQGNIQFYDGTIEDITERKQAEVYKGVLEYQKRQLHKAESLSRMGTAIAHHFNNWLGVVIGNLEMALEEVSQDTDLFIVIDAAMKSAWKAADMSSLMLTYLGQSYSKRESLDLSETCLSTLSVLQMTIPSDVILKHDLPIPGPEISANEKEIQKALINLITNAWEALSGRGGIIHVRVKTVSSAEIRSLNCHDVEWQPQDITYACLEVTDTGCGITEQDIEKLFDPFYSSKFVGRGMGLAVVMGIVRAHEGVVTVESELGKGSIFRVFLPASNEELHRHAV